jgi:hypothetical protein
MPKTRMTVVKKKMRHAMIESGESYSKGEPNQDGAKKGRDGQTRSRV